jgi:hypothetical protein
MFAFLAPAALKLLFGNALGGAASGVKAAGKWLGSLDLVHALLLAVALFGAWQTVGRWAQHRHTVKVEAQLGKCTTASAGDHAAYVKGQADAAAANLAHNAADKVERERITNDVSQSYEAKLVSLRADLAKRLRQQPTAAQGAPGSSDLPGVSPAASGPDDASRVSIPSSLYVRGAELELQLESLQHWVTAQHNVDPNKEGK